MRSKRKQPFIQLNDDAQESLLRGAKLMYDSVCITLSPKGRNVALQRPWGYPSIVNDGVMIAREVKSRDPFVQLALNTIKEAAQKTNEEAGDGTTTSILLAYELISRGMKMKEKGVNPMTLREELKVSMAQVLSRLEKIARPVKSKADLVKIAMVSCGSDEIGEMVGSSVYEMGFDGLVTVEESGSYDTYIETTKGMSIDKGFVSPYFVTDPYRMEATINKPSIIVTDKLITTNKEIVPVIEYLLNEGKKNIVIVGEVSGQALNTLVANKMNGTMNCVVIKPPGHGENRAGYLEDIAMVTGGSVISKELGMAMDVFIKKFNSDYIGKCDKVVVDAKASLFVKGAGKKSDIKAQIEGLRELLSNAANEPMKEVYEERIAKLTTGVAVMRVGAKTETEGSEKIERVKDAVGAAQAAMSEGYVAGSGSTFLRLADAIEGESDGDKLLMDVLEQPLRKVLENCGESTQERDVIVECMKGHTDDYGYDAITSEVTDVVKRGIIDPVKVIRLCVENSISVAMSILTTEVLIDFEEPHPTG